MAQTQTSSRGAVEMFRKAGFAIAAHPASGRPIAKLQLS
jgi:hypothetical protein